MKALRSGMGGHSPCTLIRPSVLRGVARDAVLGTGQGQRFPWLLQTEAGWVGTLMEGQPWAARDFSWPSYSKTGIQEKGKPALP